jgi:hypothetical protein
MPTKEQDTIAALRDLVLIEADFLAEQAERLQAWATEGVAPAIIRKRLTVSATAYWHRVKILHAALANSEPEKVAS